jgi:hypothetical protein
LFGGTLIPQPVRRLSLRAAIALLGDIPRRRRITLGADKGYDVADVVDQLRQDDVTPHVARKIRYSAIDGRTTRHRGLPRAVPSLPDRCLGAVSPGRAGVAV